MHKIVNLYTDDCAEDPCSWDGQWKLYSFNRRHTSYRDPSKFFDDNGNTRLWLRNKLRVGLAFVLSYYEHGACQWSLAGEGPQCRWDSVGVAGILVWEHPPRDLGARTMPEREKDARVFLETYTAWCNGWVYGYEVSEVETMPCGHTETRVADSCFGFYGNDLAGMKSEIRAAVGDAEVKLGNDLARSLLDVSDFAPKADAATTH